MSESLTERQAIWVRGAMSRVDLLARQMCHRLPGVSEEDLRSAGYEALTHCALRYDPESGVPFTAFAHYRIRGAMIDAARRANPGARRHKRALQALEASQSLLQEASARHTHTTAEDRRTLQERVRAAAELVAQATTVVLLSRLDPVDPDQVAANPETDLETRLDREVLVGRLRDVVSSCAEDEKRLLDAIYIRGLSMHEFAAEIGKSVSTVSRQHTKLVGKLSERIRG